MGTQKLSSSFFFLVGRKGSAYHKASRITAFHGFHSIGRSKLGIQTVLCCGVLICWLPTLGLRTLVFLKGFLKFQKMRRDKENKKPGLNDFFPCFPQHVHGAGKTREVSQRAVLPHLQHESHPGNRPPRAEKDSSHDSKAHLGDGFAPPMGS